MRSDLDRLMQTRGLDAVIVLVDNVYNPALDYLVGNVRITYGLAIKKQSAEPVLFVNGMETEEAAATGHKVYSHADLKYHDLIKTFEGDIARIEVAFWGRCLQTAGIDEGKIGIYGVGEVNHALELVERLTAEYPQYEFSGEMGRTLFEEAAVTKDAQEIERIKSVSERTNHVLQATWDFISTHRSKNGTVIKADGTPLTIGQVKRFVRGELLDYELEDTGMIFAQGRDAGIPHSRGQEKMPLELGKSIIFDLFPRELGGGYYHDVTRTWCIGYAPDDVQAVYDVVMDAFDIAVESYGLNKPTHIMQEAVLDHFESKGHPTARSHPGTTDGFVHGLGHGVGLNIHEGPRITHTIKTDSFEMGNFITIEPGLYYPDKGFGVRVEDALYIDESGALVTLTDFPKDLVLPIESAD